MPAWAPTVAQVAAILRSRTRGPQSRDASVAGEQGTFTADTRPTAAQVTELIVIATGELSGMLGGRTPCTAELETGCTTAAAYRAAQLVEIGYFSEQTNGDQTAFGALEKLWESASKAIVTQVVDQCPLPQPDPATSNDDTGLAAFTGTCRPYAADAEW